MQEWANDKGNSDAPIVRQKSIYRKEIALTVCLIFFYTKVS